MILKLGDIELNPNMTVPQLNSSTSIAQTNVPTTGGGMVVYQQLLKAGTAVQLIATEDQGWVDKKARDGLLDAATKLGDVMTLIAGDKSFNVMLDHSEGEAVVLTPFINRLIPLDGDYFIGTINLITV